MTPMATGSIGQIGLQGVLDGIARAQDASSRIVSSGTGGNLDQIVQGIVDLKQAELQVKASARVIEADAQTHGTLIDVLA